MVRFGEGSFGFEGRESFDDLYKRLKPVTPLFASFRGTLIHKGRSFEDDVRAAEKGGHVRAGEEQLNWLTSLQTSEQVEAAWQHFGRPGPGKWFIFPGTYNKDTGKVAYAYWRDSKNLKWGICNRHNVRSHEAVDEPLVVYKPKPEDSLNKKEVAKDSIVKSAEGGAMTRQGAQIIDLAAERARRKEQSSREAI